MKTRNCDNKTRRFYEENDGKFSPRFRVAIFSTLSLLKRKKKIEKQKRKKKEIRKTEDKLEGPLFLFNMEIISRSFFKNDSG